MSSYGLRGKIYNILESYLSGREQRVSIDGITGETRTVSYGVPQGTVLGPLLFTIYINGLLEIKTEGDIISFADDTAILYESNTWQELKTLVENDFLKIEKWFRYNKLTLNFDKTKYLPFSSYTSGLPNMGPLKIGDSYEIPEGESIKYLGIAIDRHLRWDLQINNVVGKLRGLLHKFKYLRDFLDIENLKTLYHALVESQLQYGIIGWGGVTDIYLKKLNTVQKYILKIIYRKLSTYPSDELFKQSGVLDVRQLFCLSMLKNIKRGCITLQSINHSHDTRTRKNNIFQPRCEKSIGQRNATYLGPRLYNIIPTSIKYTENKQSFKRKAKIWIMESKRSFFGDFINQTGDSVSRFDWGLSSSP